MNSLLFHGVDYAIPLFVDEYSPELPVIVTVTSGSSGCGYEISADEVYWIHGFQRQKRLIVKETSKLTGKQTAVAFLSIPMDYPAKFHLIQDKKSKKRRPAMSLELLLEETKRNPAPHLIMFENNTEVSFNINGQKNRSATFGVLEIVDAYNQKYLCGYSISDNTVYSTNHSIPVFLDITLDVARGVKNRSRATYRQWMRDVRTLIESNFEMQEAGMYNEIVQFSEIPDGSHYEYMRPNKFFVRNNELNKMQNYTQLHRCHTVDATNHHQQQPPPLSGGASSIYSREGGGPPPPQIPKRHTDNPPHRPTTETPLPPPRGPRRGSRRQLRLPPVRPQSPVDVREAKTASDVPEGLDFGSLTVEEVAHCLCLLGMWRHALTVQERSVDGAMAGLLDARTLETDFGFTKAEAAQFIRFQVGWRPEGL